MNSKVPLLKMDERNLQIALRVIGVMYLITIVSMFGIFIYRQFSLGQSISEFEDFAVLMTVNVMFVLTGLLYFGAVPIQKLKIKSILLGYVGFVLLGSLFTYAKYNVFQNPGLSIPQLFDKLVIIFVICGLITLFLVIFSYLGKRKLDKELED